MSATNVSTTWNFDRHGALSPAVTELAGLGYGGVELRAQGNVPDLASVGEVVRRLRVRCRSVHAPLSATSWTDGDLSDGLASTDEAVRARAVRAVLATLPVAAAAGADVVVVHLGEVEVEEARRKRRSWLDALDRGDPAPADEVAAALEERRAVRDRHLEAAARSLFELAQAESGVTWALENRFYLHEIPDLEEMELLLSDAAGANVAAWYDTGHAHLLGRLGVTDPLAWLDRYGDRTVGLHLHDARGGRDHRPPGGGEVDWAGIREYLAPGMIRVVEVHRSHSAADLAAGARFLEDAGLA